MVSADIINTTNANALTQTASRTVAISFDHLKKLPLSKHVTGGNVLDEESLPAQSRWRGKSLNLYTSRLIILLGGKTIQNC